MGRAASARPRSRCVAGVVTLHSARVTMRPLAAPLAFVALAVPLAVMLDEVGIFEELAGRAARSPRVVGACWLLAAAVVALLNLDAAVVLLTPLYVRTARQVGLDPVMLAFQPVLLAMLASGVLPVSNLTNLIAASHLSLTSTDFLDEPRAAVGRRVDGRLVRVPADLSRRAPTIAPERGPANRRALLVGGSAIALFLVLLVGGEHAGVPAWVAALVDDRLSRRSSRASSRGGGCPSARSCSPAGWRSSRRASPPRSRICSRAPATAACASFGTGVVSADVFNNLPATLVTLPHITHTPRVWPLLFGLNAGPDARDHRIARGAVVAGVGACVGCARDRPRVLAGRRARRACPAMVAGLLVLGLH